MLLSVKLEILKNNSQSSSKVWDVRSFNFLNQNLLLLLLLLLEEVDRKELLAKNFSRACFSDDVAESSSFYVKINFRKYSEVFLYNLSIV
jgi:hypothetical protein